MVSMFHPATSSESNFWSFFSSTKLHQTKRIRLSTFKGFFCCLFQGGSWHLLLTESNNTMLEVTIWSIEHHWLVNRDCHVIEHHTLPETNNVAPESRPNPENKKWSSNYLIFGGEWLVSGKVNPNINHFWRYNFSSPCIIQPTRPPMPPPFCFFRTSSELLFFFWMFILHGSWLVGSGFILITCLSNGPPGPAPSSSTNGARNGSLVLELLKRPHFFLWNTAGQFEQRFTSHRIHVWYNYLYIYHNNQINVGKYTIHGWYGVWWVVNSRYVFIYM